MPKSNSIFSINEASGLFLEWSNKLILDGFFSNRSKEGSLKCLKLSCLIEYSFILDVFSKEKDCCTFSAVKFWSIDSSVWTLFISIWLSILSCFLKIFLKVWKIYLKLILEASIKNNMLRTISTKIT